MYRAGHGVRGRGAAGNRDGGGDPGNELDRRPATPIVVSATAWGGPRPRLTSDVQAAAAAAHALPARPESLVAADPRGRNQPPTQWNGKPMGRPTYASKALTAHVNEEKHGHSRLG